MITINLIGEVPEDVRQNSFWTRILRVLGRETCAIRAIKGMLLLLVMAGVYFICHHLLVVLLHSIGINTEVGVASFVLAILEKAGAAWFLIEVMSVVSGISVKKFLRFVAENWCDEEISDGTGCSAGVSHPELSRGSITTQACSSYHLGAS